MNTLSQPVKCDCGFTTRDAGEALYHLVWHIEQAYKVVRDAAEKLGIEKEKEYPTT